MYEITQNRLRRVYVETYGCQMNFADSEIVQSILDSAGYRMTSEMTNADVVLINTCAVRENAEVRVLGRLGDFYHYKKQNPNVVVGVLGCMAKNLRDDLLKTENVVDLVVGPDEYRKLPSLLDKAFTGEQGIAVRISRVETYDDIAPLRTDGISAWLSVMRGCDKFCSYCVVPYVRGRERCRSMHSLLAEVESLAKRGFKEVTLLGQNVNSYTDNNADFADLLSATAAIDRSVRIRFMTSHPKDMTDKLIETIAREPNICKFIHLPVQSGSDRILGLMNRGYSRKHYLDLVDRIKRSIADVSLSTDIIAGFPTETEEDHQLTLYIIREAQFDGAYMFNYSPRPNTKAWDMIDDVPEETKTRRLTEIIELHRTLALQRNEELVGKTMEILVEGPSKKSDNDFCGRTDGNKMAVFPRASVGTGEYRRIRIQRVNSATLFGTVVA
jgi:tRNA-2-methylthio-N6-dimethylallyladenosine synthase